MTDTLSAPVIFHDKFMIIISSPEHKLSYDDCSDIQQFYDRSVSSLELSDISCPCCHKKDCFRIIKNYYSRYFFNSVQDFQNSARLIITGIKCSCGHTEASLPDFICPFSFFSYPFIREIINYFFGDGHQNKTATARHFSLTYWAVRRVICAYLNQTSLTSQQSDPAEPSSSSCSSQSKNSHSQQLTPKSFACFCLRFASLFHYPFLSRAKNFLCKLHRYFFLRFPPSSPQGGWNR